MGTGNALWQRLRLQDERDFANIRFMESYEAQHTNHSFAGQLAHTLGITKPPLRIDSQAKYGVPPRCLSRIASAGPNLHSVHLALCWALPGQRSGCAASQSCWVGEE